MASPPCGIAYADPTEDPLSEAVVDPPADESELEDEFVEEEFAADDFGEDEFGDELLLFEDFPVVISAARQSQKINELGVPITVISAEDIHASGLTTIPEILQFYLGVDVFRVDRNRYSVGVRGMHDFASDRTLTLINGRIANSPVFGGNEFWRLPVLIEDIDRIEVVRGPGGAAWGANAFTGVINIITKSPEDTDGGLASTTWNEYGDSYSHLRYGLSGEAWSFRTSIGYNASENSDAAGAGEFSTAYPPLAPVIGLNTMKANDFNRSIFTENELIYNQSEETRLFLGVGYSRVKMGAWPMIGYFPREDAWMHTARPYAKLEHDFDNETSGYLQYFGNFASSNYPSLTKFSSDENDIEGQMNLDLADDHHLSLGGNYRRIHINVDKQPQDIVTFIHEPVDEQIVGLFLIDRYDVSDDFTFEAQLRGDWYSGTQTDWSSRLSALYALDDQNDHIVRLSAAKAYRAPLSGFREVTFQAINMGVPGIYAWNVTAADDLDNEESWSVEAGYTGLIDEGLTASLNTYFQRFTKLIGYTEYPDPMGMNRRFFRADNIDGAKSAGCELDIEKKFQNGKLAAWYAYNAFDLDQHLQSTRSFAPARHKAGLRGTVDVYDDWKLNGFYRYSDVTKPLDNMPTDVNMDMRLDLTVSKSFLEGSGEVLVGVSDLFDRTDGPNSQLGQIADYVTPGRTFFLRVQYRF